MIIASDLDRTLLPNGKWENDDSLEKFYNLVKEHTLVYVSGRNLNLYKKAKEEFGIKTPDYFLGAVGTEVFVSDGDELVYDEDWAKYLEDKHPNWNRGEVVQMVAENIIDEKNFYLQESDVQNNYKISYYLKNVDDNKDIVNTIKNILLNREINAKVVYSFDPEKKIGLVDILPTHANKMGALEFLIEKLGMSKKDVIYAGDSGNDLLPIEAGFKSILVKNAPDEIKRKARDLAKEDNVYIAQGSDEGNGNYSSGVIEGLKYFGVIK
jgi:sucrose-6F-phosphate phosphohydrolase